jgi:hypothetical protein
MCHYVEYYATLLIQNKYCATYLYKIEKGLVDNGLFYQSW